MILFLKFRDFEKKKYFRDFVGRLIHLDTPFHSSADGCADLECQTSNADVIIIVSCRCSTLQSGKLPPSNQRENKVFPFNRVSNKFGKIIIAQKLYF